MLTFAIELLNLAVVYAIYFATYLVLVIAITQKM